MTPISPWPDWLDNLWAKSPSGSEVVGETLALHTWRVLERLRDLARIRPGLPDQIGEPRLWHRLAWACFLHDLGKAAPGFQDRLRGLRATTAARQWGRHRHEVISLAFVAWAFPPAPPEAGVDRVADQLWIAGAIVSHHRDAAEIESLYPREADEELAEVIATVPKTTLDGIHRWLVECAPAWVGALGLPGVEGPVWPDWSVAVGGLNSGTVTEVRHLLRGYQRWVRRLADQPQASTPELLLRGLILQADHTASAHTRALRPVGTSAAKLRQTWKLAQPYAHQEACALAIGSVLLTAPTGSGKTEAALLWAAKQGEAVGVLPRLFYALPYQASMNAMYRRLTVTFTQRQVGLQHGRSLLTLYRFAMDGEADPATAARQARWRRKLAYLNYFPVRVFSPYQMLKVVYRLKGYEAMLLDYYGAAFILDEIHAYEAARLGLILALVEHLRINFDARFLIMSATLPLLVSRRLAEVLGPYSSIQASAALYQEFQRHRIVILDGDLLDQLDLVAWRAQRGASVLVCCNTVQRAQDAWRALGTLLPDTEVVLLHGRFNGRDRLAAEATVREATGARTESRRPIVLVATQVVEVSLDIDLDTIFTDPAPLEALVQRFGRVNRRRLQTELAPVHVFRQPDDGQRIYEDRLVQASLAILESNSGQPLDEAEVGTWLNLIYQGDAAIDWDETYQKSFDDGRRILRALRPFQSDEALSNLFDAAFDSVEVLPANLLAEYERLREDDPIRASSLLVSISDRRRASLRRQGLLRPSTYPPVVDVPYSTEVGLDFSAVGGTGE